MVKPQRRGYLRIAYVCADAGVPVRGDKGAAVHVRAMVDALVGEGHDVVVVAAREGDGGNPLAAPVVEVRLPPPLLGIARDAKADGGPAGIEAARLLLNQAIEMELVRLHAERPLDAIYERCSLWSYAGVATGRRLGIPVLMEVNARLTDEQARYRSLALTGWADAIDRYVLAHATALLAVSAPLAADLIAAGTPADHVRVVPNGVDPARFHPRLDGGVARAAWGIAAGEIVVGFVGSIKPWHGLDRLVAALARLDDARLRLVVVGDGPERAACEAAALALPGRAIFTGAVPHAAVPAAVAGFDIAVVPGAPGAGSYFSPLKAFEYAAAGRAIVAAAGGQVEALFPPHAIALYPADAIGALAERIGWLAGDPAARARLGAAAAETVLAGFTWHRNAERVVALIREATAIATSPRPKVDSIVVAERAPAPLAAR